MSATRIKKSNLKATSKPKPSKKRKSSSSSSSSEEELVKALPKSAAPSAPEQWTFEDYMAMSEIVTAVYIREWYSKIMRSKSFNDFFQNAKQSVEGMSREERETYWADMKASCAISKAGAAKTTRAKDENAPKKPRAAYLYWCASEGASIAYIKEHYPNLAASIEKKEETAQTVKGMVWRKLSDDDKKPFFNLQALDRARYENEMKLYKEGKYVAPAAASRPPSRAGKRSVSQPASRAASPVKEDKRDASPVRKESKKQAAPVKKPVAKKKAAPEAVVKKTVKPSEKEKSAAKNTTKPAPSKNSSSSSSSVSSSSESSDGDENKSLAEGGY